MLRNGGGKRQRLRALVLPRGGQGRQELQEVRRFRPAGYQCGQVVTRWAGGGTALDAEATG